MRLARARRAGTQFGSVISNLRRMRRVSPRSVASVIVLCTAPLTAGCTSTSRLANGPEPRSHAHTVLARGVVHGSRWVLTAFSNPEGNLCMGLNDGLSIGQARRANVFAEAGCGFGPPDARMSSEIDSASAAGAGTLYFGPAPERAVRARLDSFAASGGGASHPRAGAASSAPAPSCQQSSPRHVWVAITHRLPRWTKPGGWFIVHTGSTGCGYAGAAFFDARGHRLADHDW